MSLIEDPAVICLLNRKLNAIQELLRTVKDWDESADYEKEAEFSDNLDKRQKIIDEASLIERELDGIMQRKPPAGSEDLPQGPEQIRKTNEMLRQIQTIMSRDIEQVESKMAFYSQEAARLKEGKNGITAYMKNGMPARKERYDLRG